jgi:hypothetical protein
MSANGMATPGMATPERRLHELIDFVLDGSCTDEQREEFARLIDENPDLIKGLTEEVFVHSLLQWHSECISRDLAVFGLPESEPIEGADAPVCELLADSLVTVSPPPISPSSRRYSTWALAGAVLIGGVFTLWGLGEPDPWADVAVAEIIDIENVSWGESPALKPGDRIVPGRLRTQSGEFTMRFRTGPIVKVIGAVSMNVESDMLLHLDRGQATARVPNSMKGFTIMTPAIDVIDQGTEFGVATRANGFTDVVVFDGKVDLADHIGKGSPTRLIQGEAARVDRQGTIQRIMQVGRNQRGSWWTADYPASGMNVIQEVRDNIPPADGSKYFCYQINYHCLDDDVFAYGDDPHQWNGLTAGGLPEFLRGADFVKTFNDYRYKNYFEMTVILSQPANLYVFFDDRVPPPKWLTDQFDDTGVDIGLDEGPWDRRDKAYRPDLPEFENGVGGGHSIDNIFSVWHRRCVNATPVVLGLMGETVQARSMYGVAATPLGFTDDTPQQVSMFSEIFDFEF